MFLVFVKMICTLKWDTKQLISMLSTGSQCKETRNVTDLQLQRQWFHNDYIYYFYWQWKNDEVNENE